MQQAVCVGGDRGAPASRKSIVESYTDVHRKGPAYSDGPALALVVVVSAAALAHLPDLYIYVYLISLVVVVSAATLAHLPDKGPQSRGPPHVVDLGAAQLELPI